MHCDSRYTSLLVDERKCRACLADRAAMEARMPMPHAQTRHEAGENEGHDRFDDLEEDSTICKIKTRLLLRYYLTTKYDKPLVDPLVKVFASFVTQLVTCVTDRSARSHSGWAPWLGVRQPREICACTRHA